jgi:hypothetical protein
VARAMTSARGPDTYQTCLARYLETITQSARIRLARRVSGQLARVPERWRREGCCAECVRLTGNVGARDLLEQTQRPRGVRPHGTFPRNEPAPSARRDRGSRADETFASVRGRCARVRAIAASDRRHGHASAHGARVGELHIRASTTSNETIVPCRCACASASASHARAEPQNDARSVSCATTKNPSLGSFRPRRRGR